MCLICRRTLKMLHCARFFLSVIKVFSISCVRPCILGQLWWRVTFQTYIYMKSEFRLEFVAFLMHAKQIRVSRWALVCLNLCKPYNEQHVVFRRHVSNIHSCHESKIFAIWCIESVSGTLFLGSYSIALVTVWYLLEMLMFLSLISGAQQQKPKNLFTFSFFAQN